MRDLVEITFMRHGRSRADDEGVHEGSYDSPLTPVGRTQAQTRAASWLEAGVSFDLVICSSLSRAHETAQIVADVLGLPLKVDSDWVERDNGPLAGMAMDEADALYPEQDDRTPFDRFCGTGEGDWDLYTRAIRAVQSVIRRGPGSYLVVAHGGVLNAALRAISGAQPASKGQGLFWAFGDTAYIQLIYEPDEDRWILRQFVPE